MSNDTGDTIEDIASNLRSFCDDVVSAIENAQSETSYLYDMVKQLESGEFGSDQLPNDILVFLRELGEEDLDSLEEISARARRLLSEHGE